MIPMNNNLEIGQQAVIVGCFYEQNSWAIGMVVTVEAFFGVGEQPPVQFTNKTSIIGVATDQMAIVSGLNTDARLLPNFCSIQVKYLMPIPPLGDVYDQEMMDEMENYKVSA